MIVWQVGEWVRVDKLTGLQVGGEKWWQAVGDDFLFRISLKKEDFLAHQ
jgi:hypothetical protein